MDLAWLLRGVSSKPEFHASKSGVEEATEVEGQQRCSPRQVEAGWEGPFHQSDWTFDELVAQARGHAIFAEIW